MRDRDKNKDKYTGVGSNRFNVYHIDEECPKLPDNWMLRSESFIEYHDLDICPYCSSRKYVPNQKLSDKEVREIRGMNESFVCRNMAKKYGVDFSYLKEVYHNRVRTDV